MDGDDGQVTQLLKAMHRGEAHASEQLLPLVYAELHRLASAYMRRERPGHTLQATALINEAYMRLIHDDVAWDNRAHFIGVAANVMRRVLVDYARAHNAQRRDGHLQRVDIQDLVVSTADLKQVQEIDEALDRLAAQNERQARVVELRYFGGLSVEEIASLLEISPRSVKRDWSLARLWLFRELKNSPGSGSLDA